VKTFVAITTGGWALFTVQAENSKQARDFVRSLKRRSETVEAVRLLRDDDKAYNLLDKIPGRG